MPSFATLTAVGHIAEPKFSGEGDNICARFSLAVARKRKDAELTTWVNCTCWRQDAKFLQQYAKKGDLLLAEGEPYLDEYEGKKHLKLDVRRVKILSSKEKTGAYEGETQAVEKPAPKIPAASGASELDPPFNRYVGIDTWG